MFLQVPIVIYKAKQILADETVKKVDFPTAAILPLPDIPNANKYTPQVVSQIEASNAYSCEWLQQVLSSYYTVNNQKTDAGILERFNSLWGTQRVIVCKYTGKPDTDIYNPVKILPCSYAGDELIQGLDNIRNVNNHGGVYKVDLLSNALSDLYDYAGIIIAKIKKTAADDNIIKENDYVMVAEGNSWCNILTVNEPLHQNPNNLSQWLIWNATNRTITFSDTGIALGRCLYYVTYTNNADTYYSYFIKLLPKPILYEV